MARPSRIAVLLIAGLAALARATPHAAHDVTIYRCIDAKGHLTLRDTPCAKDEKQETRTMTRPRDAHRANRASLRPSKRRAEAADTQSPRATSTSRRRVRCTNASRPTACVYTSDTSDGNPRWVPLWTLGYPSRGLIGCNFSGPTFIGPNPYGAGTYVRDTCYMLPPADVCARTRDRRDELRKRFFNAQPSERDVLRVEERSLNARLDNDCGGQ